jgi:ubiquinone/menaquinone biosynthesis methyltransferase
MASGTGDIVERLVHKAQAHHRVFRYLACDLNSAMLEVGKKRLSHLEHIHWVCGDAESLPLAEDKVSLYTIAFGLRNVSHKAQALREAYRVLAPGGFFYCLEFSQITSPLLHGLYTLHARWAVPRLGAVIAKNAAAYEYLVESIRAFPPPLLLTRMLEEAGFQETGFLRLAKGLVCLHWGRKKLL